MSKTYLFVAAVAVLIIAATSALAGGEYVWHRYGDHAYALTLTWQPWVDSESEAISVGGNLVTINDAAENEWLAATFAHTYAKGHYGFPGQAAVHIGYHLNADSQQWEWTSGEPVTYTNHFHGFPQNGTRAYLYVNPNPYALSWNANPVNTEPGHPSDYLKGVIERPVPEPAGLLALAVGLGGLLIRRR